VSFAAFLCSMSTCFDCCADCGLVPGKGVPRCSFCVFCMLDLSQALRVDIGRGRQRFRFAFEAWLER
jgi:hypothetical protein